MAAPSRPGATMCTRRSVSETPSSGRSSLSTRGANERPWRGWCPEESDPSLGRVGEISDVVDGILYLDRASFVTGEILDIGGGRSAGHWSRDPCGCSSAVAREQ